MTRFKFLAGLLGGPLLSFVMSDAKEQAKAQTPTTIPDPSIWSQSQSLPQPGGTTLEYRSYPPQAQTTLSKPANGECPVCGTKFKPKAAADDDGEPYIHGCRHCRCLYYIEVE